VQVVHRAVVTEGSAEVAAEHAAVAVVDGADGAVTGAAVAAPGTSSSAWGLQNAAVLAASSCPARAVDLRALTLGSHEAEVAAASSQIDPCELMTLDPETLLARTAVAAAAVDVAAAAAAERAVGLLGAAPLATIGKLGDQSSAHETGRKPAIDPATEKAAHLRCRLVLPDRNTS